jgi:hypothetical protein
MVISSTFDFEEGEARRLVFAAWCKRPDDRCRLADRLRVDNSMKGADVRQMWPGAQ